jgi:hypothetical protein
MGLFDKAIFKKETPQQQQDIEKAVRHNFRITHTEKTLIQIIDDFRQNKRKDKLKSKENHWIL